MVTEIKITVKGEDSKFTQSFLQYESFTMNSNDPIIKEFINNSLNLCRFTPTDIIINAKMQVQ